MECKIYFFFNSGNSLQNTMKIIDRFDARFQIAIDSEGINDVLQGKKHDFLIIDEIMPNKPSKKTDELYKFSSDMIQEYRKFFSDIKFKNHEIFDGFSYLLGGRFINLAKTREILLKQKDTVFIFEGFSPVFFVIQGLAKQMDYEIENKVTFIKSEKIEPISTYDQELFRKKMNKLSYLKLNNYLKSTYDDNQHFKKLRGMSKIGLRLSSLFIKILVNKIYLISKVSPSEIIQKRIEKKIKKNNPNHDAQTGFFISGIREDLVLKPLFPVFENFQKKKIPYLVFTSDLATSISLEKHGIPFINLFDEIKIMVSEMEKEYEIKQILKKLNYKISQEFTPLGIKELEGFLINETKRSIAILLICEYIFQSLNFKSIMVSDDGEVLANLAVKVSKKNHIPSYAMLNVILTFLTPWLDRWFHAENIFVYGHQGKDNLITLGYNQERLIIVGNTKYDYIKNFDSKKEKTNLNEDHGIDNKKKLILVGMSKWHKNDDEWMSNLIKFCVKKGFEIVIKIHPKYKTKSHEISEEVIRQIKRRCNNFKFTITYDINISNLIAASDLVITDGSNIGIEAILANKPLITANFEDEDDNDVVLNAIYETKSSIKITKYDNLEKSIVNLLNENKIEKYMISGRQKIIDRYNFKNDGLAGTRIFNILTKRGNANE